MLGAVQGTVAQLQFALVRIAACAPLEEPSPWTVSLGTHASPASPLPASLPAFCKSSAAKAGPLATQLCALPSNPGASAAASTGNTSAALGTASSLWRFNLRPPIASNRDSGTSITEPPRSSAAVVGMSVFAIILCCVVAALALFMLRKRRRQLAERAGRDYEESAVHLPRRRQRKNDDDSADSESENDDAAAGPSTGRLSRIDPGLIAGLRASRVAGGAGAQSTSSGSAGSGSQSGGSDSRGSSNASAAAGGATRVRGVSGGHASGSSSSLDSASGRSRSESDSGASHSATTQPRRQSLAARASAAIASALQGAGARRLEPPRQRRPFTIEALQRLDRLDDRIQKRMSTAG